MTSKTGKQTIGIHIFPIISRSKGNQTKKIGNIFKNVVEKLFPGPFLKNQI